MGEIGVLHENHHVELIEDELFNKSGELRLFTADDYLRMGEASISPRGRLHRAHRKRGPEGGRLGQPALRVRQQAGETLCQSAWERRRRSRQEPGADTGGSEQEPDLTLLRSRADIDKGPTLRSLGYPGGLNHGPGL
jgi:hypothetical protein